MEAIDEHTWIDDEGFGYWAGPEDPYEDDDREEREELGREVNAETDRVERERAEVEAAAARLEARKAGRETTDEDGL